MNPRLFLVPFTVFAIAALVACGGDKKDSSASSQNGSNSSSSSSQSSSSGDSGTLDLTKTGDKLAALKSFRFDVAMKLNAGSAATSSSGSSNADDLFGGVLLGLLSDLKSEGAYVAPDKTDLTVKVAGQDIGFISIGNKSWVKFGNTWQAGDPSTTDSTSSGTAADFFKEILPAEKLKGAKTSQETVNGTKATKYSFDKQAIEQISKDMGEDTSSFATVDKADLNVWMSADGVPVKLTMAINGKDTAGQKVSLELQLNIRDINSNIQIKAPI